MKARRRTLPMLKKRDGLIDFTQPVEELTRHVRAFNSWPGAYFEWNGGMLKVHRAHAEAGNASEGQRLIYQNHPRSARLAEFLFLMKFSLRGKNP